MDVLTSIQPQWCELIAHGKKTMEVRRTRPTLEVPFKVYIYCTKQPGVWADFGKRVIYNGKVIGEFTCDAIRCFSVPYPAFQGELDKDILAQSGLTYYQLHRYAYHDKLYGWHISNLKIYDEPKELCDMHKPCISPEMPYCPTCPKGGEYISDTELEFLAVDGECSTVWYCNNRVTRAPQDWCYVEGG